MKTKTKKIIRTIFGAEILLIFGLMFGSIWAWFTDCTNLVCYHYGQWLNYHALRALAFAFLLSLLATFINWEYIDG